MKLKEVLEKHDVVTDSKARRRVNASHKVANITADEIESGVTIERLQELNVPVFQYGTQVTIHGELPPFDEKARPAGYKSIIRNGNGTIGVKYVAIDAEKKRELVDINRYCRGKYNMSIDSQGLRLITTFEHKADCLAELQSFPRDLFAGSVFAAALMFGGYALIADIGAIPTEHFWTLVQYLNNVTKAEYNSIKTAKDEADRIESEARQQKYKDDREKLETAKATATEAVAATLNLPKLDKIPTDVGARFVAINYDMVKNVAKPALYVITKKVFGKPYFVATVWDDSKRNWTPPADIKPTILEKRMTALKAKLASGHLYKV